MKIENCCLRTLTLCVVTVCIVCFGCKGASAKNQNEMVNKQVRLDTLIKKFDRKLISQVETELRTYLDEKMKRRVGPVFPVDDYYTKINEKGELNLWDKYGTVTRQTYIYFDAYDFLGDKKYLQVAVDWADFLLKIQQPKGYWLIRYIVKPSGEFEPLSNPLDCRIQDKFQYGKFIYLLYTHNVTGQQKYLDAAIRYADYLLSVENENGSWPDHWIDGTVRGDRKRVSDVAGVLIGGSYNDGATTDSMEIMIVAYHLTKNPKYLSRIGRIGQWMFDTQMGEGKIRGWCQQYGLDNKALQARNFELPHIEPRTSWRFIVPMCSWFYAITGQQRYMTLIQETYDWMKSVEHPNGGWAYQYLPDGTAVTSIDYKYYRYDQRETWPEKLAGRPLYHGKGRLEKAREILELNCKEGLESIRKMYIAKTELSPDEYLDARIEAARWVLDEENLKIIRQSLPNGFYLFWDFSQDENRKRACGVRLKFLQNVRTAEGKLSAKWLAGGAEPFGGRGGHHFKVENWFDLPPLPK